MFLAFETQDHSHQSLPPQEEVPLAKNFQNVAQAERVYAGPRGKLPLRIQFRCQYRISHQLRHARLARTIAPSQGLQVQQNHSTGQQHRNPQESLKQQADPQQWQHRKN